MTLAETLGLVPFKQRLRETVLALRGDALTPASKFDLTSLRILDPVEDDDQRGKPGWGRVAPVRRDGHHRHGGPS